MLHLIQPFHELLSLGLSPGLPPQICSWLQPVTHQPCPAPVFSALSFLMLFCCRRSALGFPFLLPRCLPAASMRSRSQVIPGQGPQRVELCPNPALWGVWGCGGPTAASADCRAVPLPLFCCADPPGEQNASADDASAHMDSEVRCSTG